MTHFPQPHSQRRAPRVQMKGTVPAVIFLEDGQRAKGNLQSVSMTGGMLRLAKALGQGDFVEVAFPTMTGQVRGMAEMLSPTRTMADGSLQPFRFIALGDDEHRALRMMLDSSHDRSFSGIRTSL